MGYVYENIKSKTENVERALESLSKEWKKLGLDVSGDKEHSEAGIAITVTDPVTGRGLPLQILETAALADGYIRTGTEVHVQPDHPTLHEAREKGTSIMRVHQFNECALNLPNVTRSASPKTEAKSFFAKLFSNPAAQTEGYKGINEAMQGKTADNTKTVAKETADYLRNGGKYTIAP